MAVQITYFVHGTTPDNERGIASGWSTIELSEKGVQQSFDLQKQITIEGFAVVFCSDLQRVAQSAKITFGDKIPIIQDPRLRECNYGTYTGQPSAVVELVQEKNITTPFPEGESCEDVQHRMESFLKDIKKEYDGKHIAIVAHKAPQLALDVIVKHKTWEQAFAEDWRKTKAWQPGWEYILN